MKRRGGRVFLLLGLLLVIIVAAVFLFMSQGGDGGGLGGLFPQPAVTPSPTPEPVEVVVAITEIQPDFVITRENARQYLDIGEIPADLYAQAPSMYLTDVELAYFQQISSTHPLAEGDPIRWDMLRTPPLSYRIPDDVPSLRAVPILVDGISGIGWLLSPGDRVDIIFMYQMPVRMQERQDLTDPLTGLPIIGGLCTQCEEQRFPTVVTVAQNVQVISVETLPEVPGLLPEERKQIVVVAMQPDDAEVIQFAELDEFAQVQLVARRYNDGTELDTPGVTSQLLIQNYGLPVPCSLLIDANYPVFECSGQ